MTVPPEAIAADMVEAAHAADIAGGKHGRYRRIIVALWPLIAAAERAQIRQFAISKHAWYSDEAPRCTDPECANCDMRPITGSFADLLDGAP